MSYNKITIIGNLGRDPELRYTGQGDPVCTFSVAVNDKKRDKAGNLQDVTTWFRVTLWRKMGETAAKYLTRGKQVYIEGRLHVEEYTDKDGNNRYSLEVTATDMQFLGSASEAAGGFAPDEERAGARSRSAAAAAGFGDDGDEPGRGKAKLSDDDIPF